MNMADDRMIECAGFCTEALEDGQCLLPDLVRVLRCHLRSLTVLKLPSWRGYLSASQLTVPTDLIPPAIPTYWAWE